MLGELEFYEIIVSPFFLMSFGIYSRFCFVFELVHVVLKEMLTSVLVIINRKIF